MTSHLVNATAHLTHLLLHDTQPNPHEKAKGPNTLTPCLIIMFIKAKLSDKVICISIGIESNYLEIRMFTQRK